MKPNKIFRNGFGEIRAGWAITPLIALIVAGMLVSQALTTANYSATNQLLVTAIYAVTTIGGCVLLFKLFYGRSVRQMGVAKEKWGLELLYGILLGAIATGLLFGILAITGQVKITGYSLQHLFSLTMIVEILSLGVFVFAEELLTRGYFMTALKTTRNKAIIFFTPAVLFALLHLANEGATLLSTLNTFLAGILFAYMFVKSGKLWLPIGFHFAWNYMLGTILGLTVSGNKQISVIVTQVGSTSLWVGGTYGPEGGLLVTVVLATCFLFVKFAVKPASKNVWTMENNLPFII